jgi:DNA-binding transcriptional LysR family regulator
LTRWLAVFTEQFPKVAVEIDAATGTGPLVPEGIDLSLRLGNIEDPAVTVRKLGDLSYGLFASAKYLERKGTPQDGEDLRKHVLLMSAGGPHRSGWQLVTLSRQSRIEGPARLRAADSIMLRDAACGGLGIALLPLAIGKEEVTRGTLKRVLSAWSGPKLPVQAVYPAAHPASAKVRAFIEVAAALPPL